MPLARSRGRPRKPADPVPPEQQQQQQQGAAKRGAHAQAGRRGGGGANQAIEKHQRVRGVDAYNGVKR